VCRGQQQAGGGWGAHGIVSGQLLHTQRRMCSAGQGIRLGSKVCSSLLPSLVLTHALLMEGAPQYSVTVTTHYPSWTCC
jgi:hypothetical protein